MVRTPTTGSRTCVAAREVFWSSTDHETCQVSNHEATSYLHAVWRMVNTQLCIRCSGIHRMHLMTSSPVVADPRGCLSILCWLASVSLRSFWARPLGVLRVQLPWRNFITNHCTYFSITTLPSPSRHCQQQRWPDPHTLQPAPPLLHLDSVGVMPSPGLRALP